MESPPSHASPLLILNPAANRGKMQQHRELARRRAAQESAEYIETTGPGEAKDHACKAASEGRPVIIVGGDGSVHEVANGLLAASRRVPLGIVAAGSGNDFAWNTLKLPRDPAAALERAFSGQPTEVDAGKINDSYFVNSCSIGLDADIAVAASKMKRIPFMSGARLYYTSTLKQLLFGYRHCPWLTFKLDGGVQLEKLQAQRFVLMAITNGPTYGAGFRINPRADASDGLFDVCTIDYLSLPRALKLLPIVRSGEHEGLPEITFYRARTVHIESAKPVNVQMDGETTGGRSFHIEILPGALTVRI